MTVSARRFNLIISQFWLLELVLNLIVRLHSITCQLHSQCFSNAKYENNDSRSVSVGSTMLITVVSQCASQNISCYEW